MKTRFPFVETSIRIKTIGLAVLTSGYLKFKLCLSSNVRFWHNIMSLDYWSTTLQNEHSNLINNFFLNIWSNQSYSNSICCNKAWFAGTPVKCQDVWIHQERKLLEEVYKLVCSYSFVPCLRSLSYEHQFSIDSNTDNSAALDIYYDAQASLF